MDVRTKAHMLDPVTEQRRQRALQTAYCAFLLVAVGRLGELIPGLGSLPLARIAMGAGILILWRQWKNLPKLAPAAKPLVRSATILLVLAVVTTPFSVWPGNSLSFLLQQLPVLAASVIVSAKLSRCGWWNIRGIAQTLVVSGVLLALFAMLGFHGGRASASATYDTNDLAYLLVSVLPLAIASVICAKTRLRRLLNVILAGVIVVALLLTSSRGGFLGLLAVSAILVFLPIRAPNRDLKGAKPRNRVFATLLGIVCVSALIFPFLPDDTKHHLSTLLSLESDYNMDTSNSQSRSSIWQRNFPAALERPIGYGIDSFLVVDARTGGRFKAPHNSYLQILVELGFIGLFLFLRTYVLSWRTLGRTRKALLSVAQSEEQDQAIVFARMFQASLVGNAVAGFFLSMAYSTVLWTLIGVVIGYLSFVGDPGADSAARLENPLGTFDPSGAADPVTSVGHATTGIPMRRQSK
jgi:O-antigen ligase